MTFARQAVSDSVECVTLDLASLASVRACARELRELWLPSMCSTSTRAVSCRVAR